MDIIIGYLGTVSSGAWSAIAAVAASLIALLTYLHIKRSDKTKEITTSQLPNLSLTPK